MDTKKKDKTSISATKVLDLVKNLNKFYKGNTEEIKNKIKQLQGLHNKLETDIISNKTLFDTNLNTINDRCDNCYILIDYYITLLQKKNELNIDSKYKELENIFNLNI